MKSKRPWGKDKELHFIVSAIICLVLYPLFGPLMSAVITLIIGILKEIYDEVSGKGQCELGDLIADILGIGAAQAICFVLLLEWGNI